MSSSSSCSWSASRCSAPIADAELDLGNISWLEIVLLHIGPGALAMAFILVVAPLLSLAGLPPDLGVALGVVVVAGVARIGYLLYCGKRRGRRLTLRGAIAPWWRRMPAWQFVGLYLLIMALAYGLLTLNSPVSSYLASHFFSWFPTYMLPGWDPTHAGFARGVLLDWAFLNLALNGIVNPIVEEFYFRGNLLPRMLPKLGWWAPVVSAALFGLQHFWQPFNVPFIFLLFVVICPLVTWKRNLGLGIAVHVTADLFAATLILISILTQ